MKKLLYSAVCVFVCITLCVSVITASAVSRTHIDLLIDSILSYTVSYFGEAGIQELIDGALTENAGTLSEWYIFSLVQQGKNYDYSAYRKALEKYIAQNDVPNAVTREKYALLLSAVGYDGDYVTQTIENSTGELGLMSYVFSLHLINNGFSSKSHGASDVIRSLLGMQLPDGGWAVNGDRGDVDSTAMVIQALAKNTDNGNVKAAVEKGVGFLAARLSDSCRYSSYGVENSESTAQVIIALSSLGIDVCSDGRFIKNSVTLIDSLESYRLSDGSFSHNSQLATNQNATVQALCALVAYSRFSSGKGAFYVLDKTETPVIVTTTEPTTVSKTTEKSTEKPTEKVTEKVTEKPQTTVKVTQAKPEKTTAASTSQTEIHESATVTESVQASEEVVAESTTAETQSTEVTTEAANETTTEANPSTEESETNKESGNFTVIVVCGAAAALIVGVAVAVKKKRSGLG